MKYVKDSRLHVGIQSEVIFPGLVSQYCICGSLQLYSANGPYIMLFTIIKLCFLFKGKF